MKMKSIKYVEEKNERIHAGILNCDVCMIVTYTKPRTQT